MQVVTSFKILSIGCLKWYCCKRWVCYKICGWDKSGLSEGRFCLDSSIRRLLFCLLRNFTYKITFRVSWHKMLIHNGIDVYFRKSTFVKSINVRLKMRCTETRLSRPNQWVQNITLLSLVLTEQQQQLMSFYPSKHNVDPNGRSSFSEGCVTNRHPLSFSLSLTQEFNTRSLAAQAESWSLSCNASSDRYEIRFGCTVLYDCTLFSPIYVLCVSGFPSHKSVCFKMATAVVDRFLLSKTNG